MGQNPFDNQQQDNNPWGQQQGSGGFSQQENPFGQQQGGFGQQPQFGGPSGFNQPIEPQKRGGGAGRACLIVFGLIFACIVICCGVAVFFAANNRPAIPAGAWISLASTGSADETAGIVCKDSPAEVYSIRFVDRYPNVSSVSFNDFQIDGDVVTVEGDITYDDGKENIKLEFLIDPDGESDLNFGLIDFGCVQDITEVSN